MVCFRDSFICEKHCAVPGLGRLSDYDWYVRMNLLLLCIHMCWICVCVYLYMYACV